MAQRGLKSAQAAERAQVVRLLTFNAWLLRVLGRDLSRDNAVRVARLPAAVAETGADIVALQEVWPTRWRRALVAGLRAHGYPHAAFSPRGMGSFGRFGDGLLIASRHPLTRPVQTLVFSGTSVWYEAFIRKGGLYVQVVLPGAGPLDVFTGHLGVVRYDPARSEFLARDLRNRTRQIEELVRWVRSVRQDRSGPMVLLGDFNLHPRRHATQAHEATESPDYRTLVDSLDLVDTYRAANPGHESAWTFDPGTNPYAAGGTFDALPAERIDYVFLQSHPRMRVLVSERVFGPPSVLSDHYGVLTTLEIGGEPA